MRTSRLFVVGVLALTALLGLGDATVAQSGEPEAAAFPTGTFVADEDPGLSHEFDGDGTGRVIHVAEDWEVHVKYATHGDLYTEMTFEFPGSETDGSQTPVTYYWDWDGERLTFELWGEDLRSGRNENYANHTHRLVEDPRVVYVARYDQSPGKMVSASEGIVPGAEAADAITDMSDLRGRTTAVAVEKGQPITPDMLEPVE